MRKFWLGAALLAGSVMGSAQAAAAPAPETTDWLRSERLALVRHGDQYSGAGWDRIIADGRQAHFFMVGEQHASGTIARLETAMHAALAPHGYNHAALEVGPASTRYVEQEIRRGPGQLTRFLSAPGNGFAVPFLFFAEETQMAEQIVARSKARAPVLWGLDQEFVGAAPVVAEILRPRASTPARRAALARWSKAAADNRFLLGGGPDAEIDALAAAFRGDRDAEALMAEIRASRVIYRPFMSKDAGPIYPANLARETMMKRNFQRAFEAAEKREGRPPRVFLKFGAFHAMRGLSGTDVPALGNFLAEWGGSRGLGLVNMIIDCDGGQALDPQSGKAEACESYLGKEAAILAAGADGPDFQVFDFKALRNGLGKHPELDAQTRRAILAFDYYILVRNGAAATPVGGTVATR